MAEQTVKQLAETVQTPVDRLLKQMQEAGLPQTAEADAVSEDQKQKLLTFLRRSHGGDSDGGPKKITLQRKTVSKLKTGGNRGGKTVNVEVRKKRTFVKRSQPEETPAPAPEPEVEAVAAEPVVVPEVAEVPEAPEKPETSETSEAPATAPEPAQAPAPTRPRVVGQAQLEAERIREEESARKAAEERSRREVEEKKREDEERRQAAEKARIEEEARLKEEAREAERKATEAAAAPAAAQAPDPARAQAQAQSEQRGGKRNKAKGGGREHGGGDHGRRKRGELSLKPGGRRQKSRKHHTPANIEQSGGEFKPTEFIAREVEIPAVITVGELAQRMSVKAGEVIKALMKEGVMATINQPVEQDVAEIIVEEMGHKPKIIHEDEMEKELEESLKLEGDELPRPPVVTVMGHVDHGKTSLLDYIRNSRVTSGEAGGITQHIGAYHVEMGDAGITFIDTPGHAAFTAMRARGAKVTDIVILVVAADDGVMPQTEEAIQHARAAEVPMIVAVNKMDLEGADPDRVRNELMTKDVIPDDLGGDTQFVNVSAHTGQGVDELLEAVTLQAELLELKAVEDGPGRGVVIESRLDRGRGPVATLLVQNGSLRQGDVLIAGEFYGRSRAMINERGQQVKAVGPSMPIEILGLNGTPGAGDDFSVATDERTARELAEFRQDKSQEHRQAMQQAAKLDNLFANLKDGEKRVLKMVLKTDVRGSLEAIIQALTEMGNDEVAVNVLGQGVGGITETDVNMALTYGAVVFGFNVRADNSAKSLIERENVDLRYYSVIYELLDDVKQVLSGMLAPELREEIVGIAEVRDVFRSPKFGDIAGCMVTEGTVYRNKRIRVLRENVVIYEGELESLRRFKDDVNEVRSGTECGIGVRNYNDVRAGDQIEVFDAKEVAREL